MSVHEIRGFRPPESFRYRQYSTVQYLKDSGGQNPRILIPRVLGTDLRIITHHPTSCGLLYPHKYPHTQQPSIYHHVFTAHLILFTISAMFYGLILC